MSVAVAARTWKGRFEGVGARYTPAQAWRGAAGRIWRVSGRLGLLGSCATGPSQRTRAELALMWRRALIGQAASLPGRQAACAAGRWVIVSRRL